jgi:hypothetical protein
LPQKACAQRKKDQESGLLADFLWHNISAMILSTNAIIMKDQPNDSDRLVPQNESLKIAGDDAKRSLGDDGFRTEEAESPESSIDKKEIEEGKEKYLREIANIEGLPNEEPVKEDSPEVKKK